MTVEELCDALRNTHPSRVMCKEAADALERQAVTIADQDAEIERLAAEVEVEHKMTEGKLLPGLRRAAYILQQYWEPDAIVPAFDDVQNEIKRVEALAQSNAEPVAWQWRSRYSNDDWSMWAITVKRSQNEDGSQDQCEYRALYTAPPRPDASAGLIEAACLLDKRADEYKGKNDPIERGYRMGASFLRARAADRSEK
jgi:hypothetical protein